MSDGFHKECPECGCLEIWDADCDECHGAGQADDGSDCLECDGTGYQDDIGECGSCGVQDNYQSFDKEDTTQTKENDQ